MSQPMLACPKCTAPIAVVPAFEPLLVQCPKCATDSQVITFPAQFRAPEAGRTGAQLLGEHDASCYNHPDRRAEIACEGCGRFLCALCDVVYHGRHLCPACIATGGAAINPVSKYWYYDNIAASLYVLFLLTGGMTFGVSGLVLLPAVLYLTIRHWNTPLSVLPRGRWRLVVAGGLAGLTLGAIVLAVVLAILG